MIGLPTEETADLDGILDLELELLYPEHELKHKLVHNESQKFESTFKKAASK